MRFFLSGAMCLGASLFVLGACGSDDPAGANGSTGTDGGSNPPSTSSGNPANPNNPVPSIVNVTTETMSVNGKARTYVLSVPKTYDASRTYPVVMELHGSPHSAAGMAASYPFEKASVSDAIIVYPQAINEDSGGFSWDLGTADGNADIALLNALPQQLKTAKGLNIDPAKIFGYGYSGGGFFLQVLQCLGAQVFKAVLASAGGSPDFLRAELGPADANKCVACPGTPIPEIIVFGENDTTDGGDFQAKCQARLSGCTEDSLTATTPTPCQAYQGCRDGQPVTYCKVPGLGHEEWSQSSATAWAFFKTFL